MNVNERIVELRKQKSLTQAELATKLSMNRSVLNRIELGTRPIRDDELKALASFFEVSTDYLLGLPQKQKSDQIALEIFEKALSNYPQVREAFVSANLKKGTMTYNGETIDIENLDMDYIAKAILSAITLAKEKQSTGTVVFEIPLEEKNK